jgi:hypothetical protein
MAQVAARVSSSANRVTAHRLTDIKTLHAWEFADSETGEDSVFNGCIPSFGPFHTTPEFCRIQNQFWLAEPQPDFALSEQPVFALARYDAAVFTLHSERLACHPQLGTSSARISGRQLAALPHAAAGVIFSGQNFCRAQSQNL